MEVQDMHYPAYKHLPDIFSAAESSWTPQMSDASWGINALKFYDSFAVQNTQIL
jgi:hypothetical protein